MRGDQEAVRARLPAFVPARVWSTRLEQAKQTRRRRRQEKLEVMVRLQAEQRRAQRSELRRVRPGGLERF